MDPSQWIASFKHLHDQAKRGALNQFERTKYLGMRDELARSLMQAQNQEVPTGVPARRSLSVQQLYGLELDGVHRVMTREISCRRFITLCPTKFNPGSLSTFVLTLGRSVEPVKGDAVIAECTKQGSQFRVVADFKGLLEPSLERIEDAVMDAAISRLK